MSPLLHLCLLLTAFSTLVLSNPLTAPAVYTNCSGDHPVRLPNSVASTPFFKPQVRVDPHKVNGNGTGWEEWAFILHNLLPDGSELVYSYKWGMGDPTSADVSHQTFVAWAYFPNGTFYHQVVRDVFKYKDNQDGGFTLSIADNHLTWDPVHAYWNTSVNVEGWTIESHTQK